MSGKTALQMDPAEWRRYNPFPSSRKAPAASTEEALKAAGAIAAELRRRFRARRVVLFGSLARGEFSGRSDIDLAVWGIPPAEFYRAAGFADGFSETWKVDLVDVDDCAETLRQSIEMEGVEL